MNFLEELGIEQVNPGASKGTVWCSEKRIDGQFDSI